LVALSPVCFAGETPVAADPKAPVLDHASVFDGYRGYMPQTAESWRHSNDRVREIGGWRAYAREAEEAADPETAEPAGAEPLPRDHPHRSAP
jgi:hypothetical protein